MGAENALLYGAGVYLIGAAQHRELGGIRAMCMMFLKLYDDHSQS